MRVAVISDIHGNLVALDAVLADVTRTGVDMIVCLGDTVQGGPQPLGTIRRLQETGFPVVMGNADDWLLKGESDTVEPVSKEQLDVRAWTISKLSAEDTAFIRGYRPTVEVDLDDSRRLLCFHGSPLSYDDVLLPETPGEQWDKLLGRFSPAIMAGGHTHTQQMRRVGGGLFFNPGSVGAVSDRFLPKDEHHNDPWAEYAILSHEQKRLGLDFRRVPYDVNELVRAIRASGRPHSEQMISAYEHGTEG
jgi:predicted phosphodiesterase